MISRRIGIFLSRNGAANAAGHAFPPLLREGKSMEVSYGAPCRPGARNSHRPRIA